MLIFRKPPRAVLGKRTATPEVERIIDRLAPQLQRVIRAAVLAAQGEVDLVMLERLLEQGHSRTALALSDVELSEVTALIHEAHAAGAKMGESALTTGYRFNVTNPAALRAAETRAADLMTAVNNETKAVVRGLIARAYREQITSQQTARLLRSVIGLNDRQATALFNYRMGLVEDGLAPDRIAALADKYGARLLRQRASMIARTEIHRASNEGQHELWREAVRGGYLNPARARRIWIANVGACEWCSQMPDLNEDGVTIDGQFVTPDGGMINGPEGSHPQCRCNTGLMFVD